MANLVNHKCFITKKVGNFLSCEVENLLFQLNANNYIYSNFYVSMYANHFTVEYVAKYYPMYFDTKEFLNQYELIDVFSDSGGATDTKNITKDPTKAVYMFDEIEVSGDLLSINRKIDNPGSQILKLKCGIKANTYNEAITEISNDESKIKYCDKNLRESILLDCLEIWEIQIDDKQIESKLMEVIRSVQPYPENRFNSNLKSITFKNKSKPYFDISWNSNKSTWEVQRKFDLWAILSIEQESRIANNM